jgi:type IV secretion system protein VirB5
MTRIFRGTIAEDSMAAEQSETSTAHPYLTARREWDERYGDALARAHSWRLACLGSLAVAAISELGVIYIGAQSEIKPYVIALDKLGDPVAYAQPADGRAVEERVLEAQIANWVWNARIVLPDATAQKILLRKVYAMTGSDAAGYLNRYYAEHPPFGDFTVAVTITSVLPTSHDTWQVSWDEQKSQNGQPQAAEHWKAQVTTGIDSKLARSPRVLLDNPLGIFVRALAWTPVVGGS